MHFWGHCYYPYISITLGIVYVHNSQRNACLWYQHNDNNNNNIRSNNVGKTTATYCRNIRIYTRMPENIVLWMGFHRTAKTIMWKTCIYHFMWEFYIYIVHFMKHYRTRIVNVVVNCVGDKGFSVFARRDCMMFINVLYATVTGWYQLRRCLWWHWITS